MKLTITTLTGDKFDVEIKAEDKVKDIKAQLYRAGRFTSAVRLLHAQAPMEDDRKLCEYSLPEGTTISALFEPDADVDIEAIMSNQTQKLTVPNTRSVTELKVLICGLMRCDVEPEKLEIRLGDVTLEDPMPLHFYGIKDGSELEAVKPYVNVMIENNKGTEVYWRLNRKDTIREVKVKLPIRSRSGDYPNDSAKVEQMRLFLVTDGQNFDILDDNKTVEKCKIKEDDRLYLLSYMWTKKEKVTVKKTDRILRGCEQDDTCLGVKVKAQEQVGMPVSTIKLARLVERQWKASQFSQGLGINYRYNQTFKQLIEISDEEIPFNKKELLYIVTEEELNDDTTRVEEEREAWIQRYKIKDIVKIF